MSTSLLDIINTEQTCHSHTVRWCVDMFYLFANDMSYDKMLWDPRSSTFTVIHIIVTGTGREREKQPKQKKKRILLFISSTRKHTYISSSGALLSSSVLCSFYRLTFKCFGRRAHTYTKWIEWINEWRSLCRWLIAS